MAGIEVQPLVEAWTALGQGLERVYEHKHAECRHGPCQEDSDEASGGGHVLRDVEYSGSDHHSEDKRRQSDETEFAIVFLRVFHNLHYSSGIYGFRRCLD